MADCVIKTLRDHDKQEINVACLSWCTAKNRIIPILIKFVGDDQMVYTIRDIEVKYSSVLPNGYPYNEYHCEAVIGGFRREFMLIFWIRELRWCMKI